MCQSEIGAEGKGCQKQVHKTHFQAQHSASRHKPAQGCKCYLPAPACLCLPAGGAGPVVAEAARRGAGAVGICRRSAAPAAGRRFACSRRPLPARAGGAADNAHVIGWAAGRRDRGAAHAPAVAPARTGTLAPRPLPGAASGAGAHLERSPRSRSEARAYLALASSSSCSRASRPSSSSSACSGAGRSGAGWTRPSGRPRQAVWRASATRLARPPPNGAAAQRCRSHLRHGAGPCLLALRLLLLLLVLGIRLPRLHADLQVCDLLPQRLLLRSLGPAGRRTGGQVWAGKRTRAAAGPACATLSRQQTSSSSWPASGRAYGCQPAPALAFPTPVFATHAFGGQRDGPSHAWRPGRRPHLPAASCSSFRSSLTASRPCSRSTSSRGRAAPNTEALLAPAAAAGAAPTERGARLRRGRSRGASSPPAGASPRRHDRSWLTSRPGGGRASRLPSLRDTRAGQG